MVPFLWLWACQLVDEGCQAGTLTTEGCEIVQHSGWHAVIVALQWADSLHSKQWHQMGSNVCQAPPHIPPVTAKRGMTEGVGVEAGSKSDQAHAR
jgi:hypothetical protein